MQLDPAESHQIEQDAISVAWEEDRVVACDAAIALLARSPIWNATKMAT